MSADGDATATAYGGKKQSQLDKTDAAGDGVIYYPSGRFAVVVCKHGGGRVIAVTADTAAGQILLNFNHLGVGFVSYASGKPWVVVTADGWTVSEKSGRIVERGKFPRKQPEPIVCQVNEHLVVNFQDQYSVTAKFSVDDVTRTFKCGQELRRTAQYTEAATGRRLDGKLELDVGSIRARQLRVGLSGSLYVPAGPHHLKSERPGLGELKATLRNLPPGCAVSETVAELQSVDARMASIDLLPKPSYGAAAGGTLRSSGGASLLLSGTASTLASSATAASTLPEDFGSPQLTDSQRRLARRTARPSAAAVAHAPRRSRLPRLSMLDALGPRVAGGEAPRGTLLVVLVAADWSQACARLEPEVQVAHGELAQDAVADPNSLAAHIKFYKVDASEGNSLQRRYDFRTVPMLLMFYEGRLAAASNAAGDAASVKAAATLALGAARRGKFLPEGFTFGGQDNAQLDYIKPTWSMLAA